MQTDVVKRNEEYIKNRDAQIEKILKEAVALIDKDELKSKLLTKIVNRYLPKVEEIELVFKGLLDSHIQTITNERIEELIKTNLAAFNSNLEEKVKEAVDEELDRRLRSILKYDYD